VRAKTRHTNRYQFPTIANPRAPSSGVAGMPASPSAPSARQPEPRYLPRFVDVAGVVIRRRFPVAVNGFSTVRDTFNSSDDDDAAAAAAILVAVWLRADRQPRRISPTKANLNERVSPDTDWTHLAACQ